MTDHRSPKEIEREIERERASLSDTIDDLQDRFSLDGVVREFSDQLRTHGGDIGSSISRSVRDNPMAVAVTGVGLAWMIFGNRNGDSRSHTREADYAARRNVQTTARHTHDHDAGYYQNAEMQGRFHDSRPGMARGIHGADNTPEWARPSSGYSDDRDPWQKNYGSDDTRVSFADRMSNAADGAKQGVSNVGDRISQGASGVADAAHRTTSSASDKAHAAGASVAAGVSASRDRASNAAADMGARAAAMRERLAQGTEALSEDARERVIAARERALRARDAAADYSRQGRDRAVDLFDEQPLIAGALAIAVGAAIGAALPRTRTEDQYFGQESDDLFSEAERIYVEERAKAEKVAAAAVDEAKNVMSEVQDEVKDKAAKAKEDADRNAPADTAAQAVSDRAKTAGQRVADAASKEADKQGLGKTEA